MNFNINGNAHINDNLSYKTGTFSIVTDGYNSNLNITITGNTDNFINQLFENPKFNELLKKRIFNGTLEAVLSQGDKNESK